MPEVIEVKKYCDFLKKILHNNKIKKITILNGRYKKHGPFSGYKKIVLPLSVSNVKSKGKFIYFLFSNNTVLFNTLGLSGGWVYYKDRQYRHPNLVEFLNETDVERYRENALKHLNIEFKLEDGYLYFFDQLSYGTMSLNTMEELEEKLKKLGPDVMDITYKLFNEQINKRSNKKIGLVLMEQKIISGIGNYLRADALWLAKISPHRLVKQIKEKEMKKIYKSIKRLVWTEYNYNKAVKLGIVKDGIKKPIDYNRDFFVYGEEKDIYGNEIKKEELYSGKQKRFIYWTPKRQK